MLSYFIMHDLVNNLDPKYKEQFKSFDRIFYCANYIKLLDYYKILSLEKDEFELREKFETPAKQNALIDFFVNRTKERDYDTNVILLAYGAIVNKSIKDITKPYFDSLCGVSNDIKTNKKKQKLERIISFHLREIFTNKNKEYKKITSSYTATDDELETITSAFSDVFQFSTTKKIILKCQENLKFYYNQNINFLIFKRIFYKILDRFSKSIVAIRPSLRTSLFKKKYDYLNLNNRNWLNPYTNEYENISFHDIYKQIIDDVNIRVEKLNQVIFYQGKDTNIISTKTFFIENNNLVNPIFKKSTIFRTKFNKEREEKLQRKRQEAKDKKYRKYCKKRDKQLAKHQNKLDDFQKKIAKYNITKF